jgi:hypothetical protein
MNKKNSKVYHCTIRKYTEIKNKRGMRVIFFGILGIVLCIMHCVECMEVYGETKDRKPTSFNPVFKKQEEAVLLLGSKKEEAISILRYAKRLSLPVELMEQIASKYLMLYLKKERINFIPSSLSPLCMVNLIGNVQERPPLVIGNKKFEWKDLMRISAQQYEKLYGIANPSTCYSCLTGYNNDILPVWSIENLFRCANGLTEMPEHIRRDWIVKINKCDSSAFCLISSVFLGFGTGLSLLYSLMAFCVSCNSFSTALATSAGVVGVGLSHRAAVHSCNTLNRCDNTMQYCLEEYDLGRSIPRIIPESSDKESSDEESD